MMISISDNVFLLSPKLQKDPLLLAVADDLDLFIWQGSSRNSCSQGGNPTTSCFASCEQLS